MTEFFVEKATLRLEATSLITGTSGIGIVSRLCNEFMKLIRANLLVRFLHAVCIRRVHKPGSWERGYEFARFYFSIDRI